MANLKDSPNFVSKDSIRSINSSTEVWRVYKHLGKLGQNGFIMLQNGKATAFVNASKLGDEVIKISGGSRATLNKISRMPFQKMMKAFGGEQFTIPVHEITLQIQSKRGLPNRKTIAIYKVKTRSRTVGWYLNQLTANLIGTPKTVYICARDHENDDFDHGTCYQCPSPIVKTKRK